MCEYPSYSLLAYDTAKSGSVLKEPMFHTGTSTPPSTTYIHNLLLPYPLGEG